LEKKHQNLNWLYLISSQKLLHFIQFFCFKSFYFWLKLVVFLPKLTNLKMMRIICFILCKHSAKPSYIYTSSLQNKIIFLLSEMKRFFKCGWYFFCPMSHLLNSLNWFPEHEPLISLGVGEMKVHLPGKRRKILNSCISVSHLLIPNQICWRHKKIRFLVWIEWIFCCCIYWITKKTVTDCN